MIAYSAESIVQFMRVAVEAVSAVGCRRFEVDFAAAPRD